MGSITCTYTLPFYFFELIIIMFTVLFSILILFHLICSVICSLQSPVLPSGQGVTQARNWIFDVQVVRKKVDRVFQLWQYQIPLRSQAAIYRPRCPYPEAHADLETRWSTRQSFSYWGGVCDGKALVGGQSHSIHWFLNKATLELGVFAGIFVAANGWGVNAVCTCKKPWTGLEVLGGLQFQSVGKRWRCGREVLEGPTPKSIGAMGSGLGPFHEPTTLQRTRWLGLQLTCHAEIGSETPLGACPSGVNHRQWSLFGFVF